MDTVKLYQDKSEMRDEIISKIKVYRNLAIKLGFCFWCLAFVIHLSMNLLSIQDSSLSLEKTFIQSFQFSIFFAILGYCLGAVMGDYFSKKKLNEIQEHKLKRKRYIEEQMSIRKSKLESME
jgi:hypothetical protein